MTGVKKREPAPLEAVARRFAAIVEKRGGAAGTRLRVGGRRVAVEIATLKARGGGRGRAGRPHLRFDRVATGLIERLRENLRGTTPHGTAVLVTVTAPIRLASKTAAVLEEKIRTLLDRGPAGRDAKSTIHGNQVRIRVVKGGPARSPKLIGFVHNPETHPRLLLDMAGELLACYAAVGRRTRRNAGERWLVVSSSRGTSSLEAYRAIGSQMGMPAGFRRILVAFGDGRVEALSRATRSAASAR